MNPTHQNDGADSEPLVWRIFEGFAGLLGIIVSVGVLYIRHFRAGEAEVSSNGVTNVASHEFFVALLGFSVLSFIGAVTASKRLERILGRASWRAIGFLLLWFLADRLFL